jgi:hypothetical protein
VSKARLKRLVTSQHKSGSFSNGLFSDQMKRTHGTQKRSTLAEHRIGSLQSQKAQPESYFDDSANLDITGRRDMAHR